MHIMEAKKRFLEKNFKQNTAQLINVSSPIRKESFCLEKLSYMENTL